MEYPIDQNITHLYHATHRKNLPSILEEGLKTDSWGFIYLSEKPLEWNDHFNIVLKVTIPDINQLIDWREAWYDDDGNEIDMDHQYDSENPYYLYLDNIPPQYLEVVDETNPLKEYILKNL